MRKEPSCKTMGWSKGNFNSPNPSWEEGDKIWLAKVPLLKRDLGSLKKLVFPLTLYSFIRIPK